VKSDKTGKFGIPVSEKKPEILLRQPTYSLDTSGPPGPPADPILAILDPPGSRTPPICLTFWRKPPISPQNPTPFNIPHFPTSKSRRLPCKSLVLGGVQNGQFPSWEAHPLPGGLILAKQPNFPISRFFANFAFFSGFGGFPSPF
jgi:hypothetical protein